MQAYQLCTVKPACEARGRGCATALTAHVCRIATAQGHTVSLYADADNPHSNAVYQRVGFALIDSTRDITLTAPAAD